MERSSSWKVMERSSSISLCSREISGKGQIINMHGALLNRLGFLSYVSQSDLGFAVKRLAVSLVSK